MLAPEEVVQVLASAPSLKARVMLTIGYGCGLRGGEVTRLKVRDIDSAQGIIRVVQGKGQNRRLLAADNGGVSFRWKDYRVAGPDRWKTMTLSAHEFIRRFLLHVLPKGFHRIRRYGLLANGKGTRDPRVLQEQPTQAELRALTAPQGTVSPRLPAKLTK